MTANIAFAKPGEYAVISSDRATSYNGLYIENNKLAYAKIGGELVIVAGMGAVANINAALWHLARFEEPFDQLFHRAFGPELLQRMGLKLLEGGGLSPHEEFHLSFITMEPRLYIYHNSMQIPVETQYASHGPFQSHVEVLRLQLRPKSLEEEKQLHLRAYEAMGVSSGVGMGVDIASFDARKPLGGQFPWAMDSYRASLVLTPMGDESPPKG
jgi:hypothetical protein